MRFFVRQSFKAGSCGRFNHYYKSTISDEVINIMSTELNVNGKMCDILDKYFEQTNKH